MAEAIITRSTVIPEDVLNPIYPVEGRHVILATLKTDKGSIVQDYEINCTDGSTVYNYKTDMNGQVKFSCNSGSANIYVSNVFNGAQYIDFPCFWTNVSAPVGDTSRLNITLPQQRFTEFITSKIFKCIENRVVDNIILVGGGGGGGSGYNMEYSDDNYENVGGGGGGSGYMNIYNGPINLEKNNIYNIFIGSGGVGGKPRSDVSGGAGANGNSGGTTSLLNMSMSAKGGWGGHYAWKNSTPSGGAGGLGSGGSGSSGVPTNGTNSSINFAGGGGGGGGHYYSSYSNTGNGGSPYGGRGTLYSSSASISSKVAKDGTRGGGGGGGGAAFSVKAYGGYNEVEGKNGGSGLMRINLNFD